MDKSLIKEIKELVKIMNQSDLSVMEVADGDSRIRLERSAAGITAAINGFQQATVPVSVPTAAEIAVPMTRQDAGIDFNKLKEVKSPMIGVFYSAPAEGLEPFVKVGDRVKKGDVLCIIEAMKMMNEILAETDGEVGDICVNNGDVVEYSQVLFKLF